MTVPGEFADGISSSLFLATPCLGQCIPPEGEILLIFCSGRFWLEVNLRWGIFYTSDRILLTAKKLLDKNLDNSRSRRRAHAPRGLLLINFLGRWGDWWGPLRRRRGSLGLAWVENENRQLSGPGHLTKYWHDKLSRAHCAHFSNISLITKGKEWIMHRFLPLCCFGLCVTFASVSYLQ